MEYKVGDKVWVYLSWADLEEKAEVVKVTAKRVKVEGLGRGDGYYNPKNIRKQGA